MALFVGRLDGKPFSDLLGSSGPIIGRLGFRSFEPPRSGAPLWRERAPTGAEAGGATGSVAPMSAEAAALRVGPADADRNVRMSPTIAREGRGRPDATALRPDPG